MLFFLFYKKGKTIASIWILNWFRAIFFPRISALLLLLLSVPLLPQCSSLRMRVSLTILNVKLKSYH
jgi:hypothetical protein